MWPRNPSGDMRSWARASGPPVCGDARFRQEYSDVVEVVGLCDVNRKRAEASKQLMGATCPTFTSFDAMCETVKPDRDGDDGRQLPSRVHREGLDRGLDVITEKPMVIDANQCQAVLDAEARNKRKIIVTFNYRYAPKHGSVKELLMSGEIGRVLSVDFAWYLDVIHGADYFRRWHRLRNGGGRLCVHKATHHFDLMNWWLGADPVEVVAHGELKVYGKNSPFRHTHCRQCSHKKGCRFHYDMTKDATQMKLYGSAEDVDGYHRDGCVFREDVNIFDTMSAMVTYSNGATMTYALDAYLPY